MDAAVTVLLFVHQMALLLQRASVLWQPASPRDDHDFRTHTVEVCFPDNAQTAAWQVPCWEGQNAAGKADSCSHALSTVAIMLLICSVAFSPWYYCTVVCDIIILLAGKSIGSIVCLGLVPIIHILEVICVWFCQTKINIA